MWLKRIGMRSCVQHYSQEQEMQHSGVQEWLRMRLRESK